MPQPITAAVIPVAGLGTRLLPATKSQPKEMLPVVDVPVVQYVVAELAAAGIERVLFVTGRRKRAIEDHFDVDAELERALDGRPLADPSAGLELLYTRQARPAGLGDAVLHAAGFAGRGPVVVALGDTIIRPAPGVPPLVDRLCRAYAAHTADVALAVEEVPLELVSRYGILTPGAQLDTAGTFAAAGIVEKPTADPPSRWAVAARYVVGPPVFDALRGGGDLTEAIASVLDAGGRVLAVPLAPGERRHDVGTVESYAATFVEFALTDPRIGAALRLRAAAVLDAHR